jgi:hypothetical protein
MVHPSKKLQRKWTYFPKFCNAMISAFHFCGRHELYLLLKRLWCSKVTLITCQFCGQHSERGNKKRHHILSNITAIYGLKCFLNYYFLVGPSSLRKPNQKVAENRQAQGCSLLSHEELPYKFHEKYKQKQEGTTKSNSVALFIAS